MLSYTVDEDAGVIDLTVDGGATARGAYTLGAARPAGWLSGFGAQPSSD